MHITKTIARQLVSELARDYNVRLHYTKTSVDHGYSRYWNNSISINTNQSAIDLISTFFHEIGHIYCWSNNKWMSYHVNKPLSHLTKDEQQKYLRTALKAERWVDKWAATEMSKHFHDILYQPGYQSVEAGEEFTKYIKKSLHCN